jgi:hypothetical protein
MNSCPLCGGSVSEERPRHRIVLEIEDTTRSTKQLMGDETDIKRYCVNQQVCPDCWEDLRETLS